MRFRTSDGYTLQTHSAKNLSPRSVEDLDLTFQDKLGWPVDDSGQKSDGEFLRETPGEAARRRIDSVLNILEDWDDWTTEMGGDEDEDDREDLAKIRRMKRQLRRALKGLEISMISPKDLTSIRMGFAEKPHGTRHRYLGGCRCVPCRAANSRYSCGRAAAQRAGDWRGFVPATLVLGHIRKLRKVGIGYKTIAAAAGLAKSAMILIGKRRQIRKHNADRILAVDRTAVADCALVSAGGTWALLNELLEAGYTKTFLAKQLGSHTKRPSLQIQADRITALTASKVERLYRRIRDGRVYR